MYLRLLLASLLRRRTGNALAVTAVSLGVAALVGLLGVGLQVGDRVARELRSRGANLRIEAEGAQLPLEIAGRDLRALRPGPTLEEEQLGKLRKIFWRNNLVAFAPFLPVPGRLPLVGTWFDHPVGDDGFRTGLDRLAQTWTLEGRWPREGSSEVVLGRRLAGDLGLGPGDTLRVQGHRLQVSGVYTAGDEEDARGYIPLVLAQRLSGLPGRYRWALVSAVTTPESRLLEEYGLDPTRLSPEEYDRWYCTPYPSSIAHQIGEALPGARVWPLREVTEGDARVLRSLQGIMAVAGVASILAAVLAAGAAMAATLQERRVEMALLRVLGAGRSGVGWQFLGEALVLGVLSGLIGFGLGSLLSDRLGVVIFGGGLECQPVLLPVALALGVSLALAGTAAVLPQVLGKPPAAVLAEAS